MSNSNTEVSDKQRIALLEKALKRERNTKKILEAKLDERNQINFDKHKDLLEALTQANSRQVQLQFLSLLTQDVLSDKNIDQLIYGFVYNLSTLLEKCPAIQIIITGNKGKTISVINEPSAQWERLQWYDSYTEFTDNMLAQRDFSWQRLEHKNNAALASLSALLRNNTLLYLPLHISKTQQRVILLDIMHYCYSDDFKQTLDTAAFQFTSLIQRRVAEIELAYNNRKLKTALNELKATQRVLANNEKMISIGQLSAGIAHEVNNPIGYISSNLEVLKDYIDCYEETLNTISQSDSVNTKAALNNHELIEVRDDIKNLINSCIDGVSKIADIVASLNTFSRRQEDQYTPVNLNNVITDSLTIVWNKLKYKHSIVKNLSEELAMTNGNQGQLQQVFINLFINASQAMKDGGTLSISTQESDGFVQVDVSDTGCGMDNKVLRRLFEPFYTTKGEHEGTGLGLSVSYAIIEKHGALISVNSEPEIGSTFTLRFPILISDMQ